MKKLLLALVPAMMMASAYAESSAYDTDAADRWATPLEINLASPLQVPFSVRDVWGIRANIIYGRALNVYGLDFGLVGVNNADMSGVELEGFNWIVGNLYGLQVGAIGNVVMKHAYGVQLGGIINRVQDESEGLMMGLLDFTTGYKGVELGALTWDVAYVTGAQVGLVNVAKDVSGAEIGALNFVNGNMTGAQIGLFNSVAGIASGVQIGAFNAAQNLTGLQIGLININAEGAWPIMVIVNANF